MRAFTFKFGKFQVVKEGKELIKQFINQAGLTKEQILEEINKAGYPYCYFCINPETLQYWIEPVAEDKHKQKEDMFTRLYGTDFPIPMNTLRTKIFNEFLNAISRKHIVKPNPEGYLTTCLSCGGNLLVNKYTGNTYCYSCKRELPFEYLFEILKGLDIYSIVQEIQNQQLKRKVMRW